jgi:hypothetical protein
MFLVGYWELDYKFGNSLATLFASPFAKIFGLLASFFWDEDFCMRRCPRHALRPTILPVPVLRNLFAADLFVFSFIISGRLGVAKSYLV